MNLSNCYHEFEHNGQVSFRNYQTVICFGIKSDFVKENIEFHEKIEKETLEFPSNHYDLVYADVKNIENIDVVMFNLSRITKTNGYVYLLNANKVKNIQNFNFNPIFMEENLLVAKKTHKQNKTKLLDIVIVSFAKNEWCKTATQKCIESLLASEKDSEKIFNIIVVESNYDVKWDHISPCVTTYKAPLPYGYHKFLNFGRKKGNAEWVALCNNDIIFSKEWFTKILESSVRNKDVLSFSPICSFTQVKNKIKVGSGDLVGHQLRIHISGWCIVQKRKIYDIIGDLDENFIHWCCDSDYALSLFKNDLKHVLVTDSVVDHHDQKIGMTTIYSVKSMQEISDLTVGSKQIFEQKYGFEKPKFDITKDKIINDLITKNNYRRYLEIGVRDGFNLQKINCEIKSGVDPHPRSKDTTHIMTSDTFFDSLKEDDKFDIILIDGLHTEEQVDKDIANSLTHLADNGAIILHDCNPPSEFHAKEIPFYDPPISAEWNGTVYKSLIKLRMTRTDLSLITIDTDYGIGIITKKKSTLPILKNTFPIDSWEFFIQNKKEILNLMTYEDYKFINQNSVK